MRDTWCCGRGFEQLTFYNSAVANRKLMILAANDTKHFIVTVIEKRGVLMVRMLFRVADDRDTDTIQCVFK